MKLLINWYVSNSHWCMDLLAGITVEYWGLWFCYEWGAWLTPPWAFHWAWFRQLHTQGERRCLKVELQVHQSTCSRNRGSFVPRPLPDLSDIRRENLGEGLVPILDHGLEMVDTVPDDGNMPTQYLAISSWRPSVWRQLPWILFQLYHFLRNTR